jgi:ABC-2 type transport system permease protein
VWTSFFLFEIRYHLRQPLFYLVSFFLSVLLFVGGTGHRPGAGSGRLQLNAPAVILELLVEQIFLILFLLTALVASAAIRDYDRRTHELFFSKPVSPFAYLTGRFAGVLAICTLSCLIGAAALAVSAFMPWLDPARLGPFRLAPFAYALGILILPTVVALGAAFYALASFTRSTIATYLGVAAFFAGGAAAGLAASRLETRWIGQLLDPFGVAALRAAVEHWKVEQLNAALPDLGGMLLLNRLLWLVLGLSALGTAVAAFDRSRPRKLRGPRRDPAPAPVPAAIPAGAARPVFSRHAALVQFGSQLRREAANVMGSFAFLGMLAFGLFILIQEAGDAGNLFGMPVNPRTHLMLEALRGGYSILLLIVVVLYGGELVFKERTLRLHLIQDALPAPSGVFFGAKLAALLLAIVVFLGAGVAALALFQLSQGYDRLEPGLYLQGAAMAAVYPALMLVLSAFCHVVARSRIGGYGLVILFVIAWDLLEELGFEHHIYRFASLPPAPYSDFAGYGPFLAAFGWLTLYWSSFALVLAGLSILFWKRGTDLSWRARRAAARAKIRGPVGAAIGFGLAGFVAAGSFIFYNTNVLNEYRPSAVAAERRAAYERSYRQYQGLELPRIVAVRADVDLFPERGSVEIRGIYRLRNTSAEPQRDLHLSLPEGVRLDGLELPAHEAVLEDAELGYRIYRLKEPLAPGSTLEIGFGLELGRRGFANDGGGTAVISNGSYFTRRDVFPVIGYDAQRQLEDPEERRRRGLEPFRLPAGDDLAARRNSARASDADRVDFETTLSTSLDQIAVTSGELQREWVEEGRRHFRYLSEAPITHFFAFASARYEVAKDQWNGVAIELFHHPGHGENAGRMIDAAKKSLAYNSASFGPFQHRHLRIVEYPGYVRDATSFPGMIALSESLGWNARLGGGEAVDFPFYVTAHEVAHQWWGQQLVGANVKGVGMLHETLAQYSALMVAEREFGKQKLRRILDYELDWYRRGRAAERGEEPPLVLAERQDYVYYHKGALAMYALREAVGEERLNAALARFLARVALKGPPYPTAAELLAELRGGLPTESAQLVEDLFEKAAGDPIYSAQP